LIQVPTTLLAQVDSSVGGKTGIDTRHGKNLVGAFHQPRLVVADTGLLDTLPRRELLAGYAEVAKYGLLGDEPFFTWLERHGAEAIAGDGEARHRAVMASCQGKARIVAADETEHEARALLNLGHTFGHALEAEAGYGEAVLHGEAVAVGMAMAFALSVRLGLCPPTDAERVRRHLAAVGLPVHPADLGLDGVEAGRLLERMAQDKKVKDGRIGLVLVKGVGRAFLTRDIEPDVLRAFLEETLRSSPDAA
jgi:3-dehydroquinate synthase